MLRCRRLNPTILGDPHAAPFLPLAHCDRPFAGAPAPAPPVQPPALPRQGLGQYQRYYDRAYARSIAQQNQQANPLLTGQLLFGIMENPAQVAARAASTADRYAMNFVRHVQQRAAAAAAQRQAAIAAQQAQNDLYFAMQRAIANQPVQLAAAAA